MKKLFILLIAAVIASSGCIGQKTVKSGDTISVDYIGSLENGEVFDTSIKSVAIEKNISTPGRVFTPYKFTVGKGEVIPGFDEGVVGMKVGETRTLTIPPEKAYGKIDPRAIQTLPVIQTVPATSTFPKVFNISLDQFEGTFGPEHKKGDVVKIQGSNINLTILNISSEVSLSYNLKAGDLINSSTVPWSQTVVKIDDRNITVKHNVKKNDVIQYFQGAPWDSTVLDVDDKNITIRNNAVPDTEMPTMFGAIKVHFNETHITLDQNHELAGKTLVFRITLKSIGEVKKIDEIIKK